ncbi:apolipoprotein N-acyltransferase [Georgenia satyanarayanai]|uniref:apolipoprotein N-acyltransferase n=2 Tax=Georgenia TaxID=154116 RepID=UPI00215F0BDC|nr:apolipoprotein N-acyltransferase [Georgenia satyanarayanai]
MTWPLVMAAGGGVLTNLAFPDRGWWPLAYLGVALLLLALRRARMAQAAATGLVWGVAFFLPHVYWVIHATGALVPWIALSMMQALYIAGFTAAWTVTRRAAWVGTRPVVQACLAAVIWVAVEQLRASWPFGGFPWGMLAFSQTDAPLVRLAPYGGEVLVSAVVVFIGALLTWAWTRRSQVATAMGAAAAGLILALGPGLLPLDDKAEVGTLRVGAVQGNVPQLGAEWAVQAREVTANHTRGTRRLVEEVGDRLDLVLWPESAADIDPRTDDAQAALVEAAARAAGAPVLLGTQRFPTGQDIRYNELVLWQEGGPVGGAYAKQHPVPFGEYMPYRDLFRRITPLVDRVSTDMAAGRGPGLMPIPVERLSREVEAAVGICFEVAYAGLIREGVVGGGELIIIPTNNASFGDSPESTQQLAMSRFRAVEHGRATVQVSTVGVSGIILPDGSVVERTGLFTAEEMTATLPLRTSLTPAARLGTLPTVAVWVVAAVGVAAGVLSRRGRGHSAGGPARRRTATLSEGRAREDLTAPVSLVTGH